MTLELFSLTACAVLCATLFIPYGVAQLRYWGIQTSIGNRVNCPELPAWANRAVRAHRNLLENLPHFSALVLVSHIIGTESFLAEFGAILFFGARVVHAIVYILGILRLRTIAFFVGWCGEGLILLAILQH